MNTIDFLTIPWGTWTTDANCKALLFAIAMAEMRRDGMYPKFEFTLETKEADEFALRLYEDIYLTGCSFRLDRGPLGGGQYIFQDGMWKATSGAIDGRRHVAGPPAQGEPASFSIVLTGPPDFKDLLKKLSCSH